MCPSQSLSFFIELLFEVEIYVRFGTATPVHPPGESCSGANSRGLENPDYYSPLTCKSHILQRNALKRIGTGNQSHAPLFGFSVELDDLV